MGRKTYLKIVMPSAPTVSFAPYDSQTIGLTTWDEAATIDGITYHPARFALGDGTSTGDFSKGKGGLALGNQIASLEVENIFSGGLLKNYVDAGTIPLVGAVVTILDGVGATPQTWVLQEPSGDGPVLSFKLCTPGYLNQKRLQFAAMRYDGAATVGLAVGDASVRGINAAGRYKGVSVPTKTATEWATEITTKGPGFYQGTPNSPRLISNSAPLIASEVSTNPVGNWGDRKAFKFIFKDADSLNAFWDTYVGLSYGGGTYPWATIKPNLTLFISDGNNTETILRSDSVGVVLTADAGAPKISISDGALADATRVLFYTGQFIGTAQNAAYAWMGDVCDRLVFAKDSQYNCLYVSPATTGSLYSASAESVKLYSFSEENKYPICAGSDAIVGFGSGGGFLESPGSQYLNDGVIYFLPKLVNKEGFEAWTDLLLQNRKIGFSDASQNDGAHFATWEYTGDIGIYLAAPLNEDFGVKITADASAAGGHTRARFLKWKTFLKSSDFEFSIDKIFCDFGLYLEAQTRDANNIIANAMLPFQAGKLSIPFSFDGSGYGRELMGNFGKGVLCASRIFNSIEDMNKVSLSEYSLYALASDYSRYFNEYFRGIQFYSITKLAFGSNPAVVVPGNFPGTSNPTTTPTLAAAQLAAWLGFSNISLTGGITPTAGTWGEYLGEDPSSTSSDDTTSAKDRLSSLLQEACIYGAETGGTVALPDVEVAEHPSTPSSSIDDVVTMPQFTYCYAGTSAQFTAKILNVDEAFDISRGDGYYWGGWQEKDTCHVSTSPGSAVLAMCQLEDCLAVVCADGHLRCSYDGGVTWPFAMVVINADNVTTAKIICGNGMMLVIAEAEYLGTNPASITYVSKDAGRTWVSISALVLCALFDGWYDSTMSRFWICGKDADGNSVAWYSTDGSNWTGIGISESSKGFHGIAAVGNLVLLSHQDSSGGWSLYATTDLGANWHIKTSDPATRPYPSYWDGKFRAAWGLDLFSSIDLSTWTNVATSAPLQDFATDGKVVSALGSEAAGGNHVYYSRDQGATWKAVRVSPEGATWAQTDATVSVWDDNAKCFRFAAWGPTRIIALGDPSVLDIWIRCREAYLATSTLASDTFDKRGLYDASELVRWLLDCKDGTDAEYQQPFIKWITRPARFVIVRGKYQSIVDQLSVAAGLPITIPRKMLTYSGYDQNLPTRGIISKATHTLSGTDAGLAEIEIIMPPL